MGLDWEGLGSEGIRFFGRLGAAAAKDMARILADLSRQAEHVAQMAELAERGLAPDGARLAELAGRLDKGVARAEALLERVAKAADTAESPVGIVNVSEIAERMVLLLKPQAERREIGLVLKGAAEPAFAASNAFFLQNLLYLAVEQALVRSDQGPVEVLIRHEENGASVTVTAPGQACWDPALRKKLALLAHSLEAEMTLDEHRLALTLPSRGRLIQALARDHEHE